ncbi:unnamed protein product [Paramecium primaurelia]|uniref:Transmembrane protein n=1 Tax=Paramecium primaurelia TaxID=5886 RepID=A0A8S1QKN9_PARPR|nr:unnamed protein product [Paramecium primaurelia]
MKILKFIKEMDVFGALLFQKVDQTSQIHKSVLGGFISILLFSSSLAYTIFEFYQWNTYQLSPKISTSNYASDFELLDLKYDIVKFHFWKDQRSTIDPFENKILIPMISYTQNYTIVETHVLNLSNETSYQGNYYIIPEMRIGFTNIKGQIRTTSEMFIFFVKCQQELLKENEQCASQEMVDQFFSQPLNTISIQLHYKQIDSKDASISQSIQELLIQVERESCYTLNTYLQTNRYQVKNSFLFGQAQQYEFVNGVEIQPQTNSLSYCQQAFGYETYAIFFIEMNGNQIKTIIEYPNLGDVLANIGSIIQVLFMTRFIIIQINSYLQHQQVIHQLISFYYPQFSNIKIFKNWRGRICKVCLKNQELDIQEFLLFYNNITKQMEQKLTLMNILYEISRLYLLIRSIKSRDEINRCHQIGIPLKLRNQSINNELDYSPGFVFRNQGCITTSPTSSKAKIESLSLNSFDVNILSLNKSKQQRQDNLTEELSFEEHRFYDLNKILW